MNHSELEDTLYNVQMQEFRNIESVAGKINTGVLVLTLALCWNTVLLLGAHPNLEAPDWLEAAKVSRMYHPGGQRPPVIKTEVQREENRIAEEFRAFVAENYKPMTDRSAWTEYIEDLQSNLAYRKNILELPVIGVTLEKYSIELFFGVIFSAALVFVFIRSMELNSYLRYDRRSREEARIVRQILMKKNLISPNGLQLGAPIMYLAVWAINLWNVSIYYHVKGRLFCESPDRFKVIIYCFLIVSMLSIANIFVSFLTTKYSRRLGHV